MQYYISRFRLCWLPRPEADALSAEVLRVGGIGHVNVAVVFVDDLGVFKTSLAHRAN